MQQLGLSFKSFATPPCTEGGMSPLWVHLERGQQAASQKIADGSSFTRCTAGTNVLHKLILIQVLAPCAQVQCPGLSSETDKMYCGSGSSLNSPVPNTLKGVLMLKGCSGLLAPEATGLSHYNIYGDNSPNKHKKCRTRNDVSHENNNQELL